VSELSPVQSLNPIHCELIENGIVTFFLLVYLLAVLFTLRRHKSDLYKMFLDYRFARKHYEDSSDTSVVHPFYVVLFAIINVASLLALQFEQPDYRTAALLSAALSGVMLIQAGVMKVSGMLCQSDNIFNELEYNRKHYLSITGIIICPVTMLALLYDNQTKIIALEAAKILGGVVMILMFVRLMKIFAETGVSYFFRFLYLCGLEISPYIVLYIVFKSVETN
jgi:hypothetical protein